MSDLRSTSCTFSQKCRLIQEQHTTRKTRTGKTHKRKEVGIAQTESGYKWAGVGKCDRGQRFLLADSGVFVTASQRSSDIHQVCLSLGSTAGLQRASPAAGTAPDKDPLWRGFLSPQTSAGKRLRRTNECFCGKEELGTVVKETIRERERGTKQGIVGVHKHTHTHTQSLRRQDTSSIGGPVGTYSTFVQCIL